MKCKDFEVGIFEDQKEGKVCIGHSEQRLSGKRKK